MPRKVLLFALLAATATLAISADAGRPSLRQFQGIPVRENPEDIAMWGEGDSFEDIFESITVRSSSALPASEGSYYDGSRAHDLSLQSAWVEGAKRDGIGQYVEYKLRVTTDKHPADASITGLVVFNGYRKNRALWQKNNRVRRLWLSVNGKPYGIITLADSYACQKVKVGSIKLPPHAKTLVLRFTIESVYSGAKYKDTALTELGFEGTGIY